MNMLVHKFLRGGGVSLAAALAALAADAAVYDVRDGDADALTNAFAQATGEGDVVRVYPGTYLLTGKAMTGTASLKISMKAGGRFVGMGETPDETLIVGGGEDYPRRLLGFADSDKSRSCIVSNLTLTGGYASSSAGGVANDDNSSRLSFTDCVVSNNAALNGGAFSGLKIPIIRCRIVDNRTTGSDTRGMALWDCVGMRDCLVSDHKGGSINHQQNGYYIDNIAYSNCTFTANTDGQAMNGAVFTDCVFSNTTYNRGGTAKAATNCLFVACTNLINMGGAFVGCTFEKNLGLPMFNGATLNRCVVRGNSGVTGWFLTPLLGDGTKICNSLIAENVGSCQNGSGFTWGSSFYNCTVVSNLYEVKNYSVLYTFGSRTSVAVNTVFVGNRAKPSSTRSDYSASAYSVLQDFNANSMPTAMTNCVWTAMTGELSDTSAFPGCRQVAADELRFADPANGDWTLRKMSPLRNAGWSDEAYLELLGDKDLAGKRRVARDGGYLIDIGAYELNPPLGAILMVR